MNRLLSITTLLIACHAAPPTATPAPARTPTRDSVAVSPVAIGQLAAQRARLIAWLHDYTEAAMFPTDELGRPLSVFEDARGVRCPMAELIYRSGHADLVAAIARDHNTLRLRDVTGGPLLDWMLASGLTRDEIAMVQGAMDIDYTWMQDANGQPLVARGARLRVQTLAAQALAARAQAKGRLETAERALRDGTRHALVEAALQLPHGRLPTPQVASGGIVAVLKNGPPVP